MPRVLIVDDHAFIRRGVRSILESAPEWQICGEAENGTDGIRLIDETKPDVVLMDITMPGMNGLEATRLIQKSFPNVKVLLITLHESSEMLINGFRAGALGYLLKTDAEHELLKALRIVIANGSYISPRFDQQAARKVIEETRTHRTKRA
jgi:DNA-binding NarL/FixJ family response regulator